ncbi:MAG: hypothetical protein AAF821_07525 [Cyanobacteria bacterium P01_D01_bin.156]
MKSILKYTLASVTGLGFALGLVTAPVMAQVNGGFDDLSGDVNSNEVFSGSDLSLTDIIGNLRRADGLSTGEFSRKSDRNINEAASDFRRRQQEAIDAQPSVTDTPVVEEQL